MLGSGQLQQDIGESRRGWRGQLDGVTGSGVAVWTARG